MMIYTTKDIASEYGETIREYRINDFMTYEWNDIDIILRFPQIVGRIKWHNDGSVSVFAKI